MIQRRLKICGRHCLSLVLLLTLLHLARVLDLDTKREPSPAKYSQVLFSQLPQADLCSFEQGEVFSTATDVSYSLWLQGLRD